MRLCTGDLTACEDALIYGYNLEGTGVDEDSGVIITKSMEFEPLCDAGSSELCDQLDAGMIFQYGNIASAVLGGLGLLLLIIPCTRKATCGFFISAGVSAAAAFAGFLIMSKDLPCWDVDNTDVDMAASCWLDIAALALFVLASIITMGAKRNNDRV
eukprot:CAMPEP_0201571758 /NCGR_PEP_ID=MMETSP0190_2-20130828/14705_1 /ASSEMBLY_ACC=CAM_ASM_000263 /TAXON_ID=37353 /ORGANISM="Rosalina sp." /LENGTH=156 /DNA_ID=CAMNT_0047996771 /DNA_START=177 /DNA_END=647 /DNA_ORIENTATION=-